MDLTIVVALYNEQESLPELTEWINRVCEKEGLRYELIMVDDGSKDKSWETIVKLKEKYPPIRAFRFQKNHGKSTALRVGFQNAVGKVVITMDADLQDSPDEIPALYEKIEREGYDVVSGWKKKRYDNVITKNIPSKIFNLTTSILTGIKLHDFNSGLKAYRLEVVRSINLYGELHRYIPVLAYKEGFSKIGEMPVKHRPRKYGESKFGWSRFINGFLDLLTVLFITRFSKRPMHFFGLLGMLFFLIGGGFTTYLLILKLGYHDTAIPTNRLSFYIALTTLIIGVQLFLAGFILEIITLNSNQSSVLIKESV